VKILIVDDSKAMRMIVRRTLREAGYHGHDLTEAPSAVAALEVLQSQPFDLILSDWNMPEMTGLQMLEKLNGEGRKIKFGFITSESTDEMKNMATQAGALFLITKPFSADVFHSVLGPILG
jgi:two-component system, chemotaxis family, chemotaxis protein CheY